MSPTARRQFALGLAAFLVPAMAFVARNADVYDLAFLLPALGVTAGIALALLLACAAGTALTRRGIFASVFVATGMAWFLQFWHATLADLFSGVRSTFDGSLPAALVLLALGLACGAWSARAGMQRFLAVFLGWNLVMAVAGEVPQAWARMRASDAPQLQAPAVAPLPAGPRRDANVYYVLVDGMASESVLRELGIATGTAVQDLTATHGYAIAPAARASYNATYLTLASIFYQAHPVDEASAPYRDRSLFFPQLLAAGERVSLLANLGKLGYGFTHVGNSWAPCRASAVVRCLNHHGMASSPVGDLLGNYAVQSLLEGSLLERGALALAEAQVFGPSIHDNDALHTAMRLLREHPEAVRNRRNFFFIHHMNPHPPARNAACELLEGGNYTREDLPGYSSSVACALDRMRAFAELVGRVDPDAIVVFQGDHGAGVDYRFDVPFEQLSAKQLRHRFGIFNAIKVPPECRSGLAPALDNVGTINLVVGCIAGQVPAPQPPKSYAGFYEGAKEFGRVRAVPAP